MTHVQEPEQGASNPASKSTTSPKKTAASGTAAKKIALPQQFQAVRDSVALTEVARSTPLLIIIILAMWLGWSPEQI
ncbi:hypothetical protein GCM10011609_84650 [Lentzea pudingi]|uniref:Uncharacterized protein n=1 Tax=Lentzea pudingi TaxID=1789439 RepID=A0ABQ2IT28_9PSEU|nr:hypothetical protein [Lentzea pudingi]GGN28474.1 hypothetical protein GCM10011609_84650 [Lentzea pudingi]